MGYFVVIHSFRRIYFVDMKKQPKLSLKTLEVLGLKEVDMNVYSTLLSLGSAPLRRIAEEAKLSRGTTYDIIKRLMSLGAVSYVDAKTHRYFSAEEPVCLRGLATRREVSLAEAREELLQTIPLLEGMRGASQYRPTVRYYEGEAGIRVLLEDVLSEVESFRPRQYRVYSSAAVRDLVHAAWPSFNANRIKRRIKVKAIALGEGGRTHGLDERRFLNQSTSPTYMFIYGGKTAHVSLDQHKRLFGVIIEDSGIATTQTLIFDALWGTLPA